MIPSSTGAGRLDQILHWLQAEGRLDVADVAGRLGVAQETVRRDLRVLEVEQKLQRVHGGAVPLPASPPAEPSPLDQSRFGARVWERLPRTGTVLIGAGRLAPVLARAMLAAPPDYDGLTVVTNQLDVAVLLSRAAHLAVYNLGGAVNRGTHAQEGAWVLTELARLRTDVAVLSPAGVSVDGGITELTPAAAAVTRAVVDGATRIVVLADRTALRTTAFVRACDLAEVHELAAGDDVPPAAYAPFVDRGLTVGRSDAAGGCRQPSGYGEATSVPHRSEGGR